MNGDPGNLQGSSLAENDRPLRILVIRPDRLGDVVLSTPVFETIKKHYPRSHLAVMVRQMIAPVVRGIPSVDETLIFEPEGRHSGLKGLFRLASEIRGKRIRIAVVLQSNWKLASALFLARVRYRIGPLSKPHSYLFYNRGLRQHRSQVEMHEADYNLQLLRRLGIRVGSRNVAPRVAIPEATQQASREWLHQQGWKEGEILVAVHPGMAGSALNWPESHYVEFIRSLIKDGKRVLVTGGPTEGPLLDRIKSALGTAAEKVIFYGGTQTQEIDFLGGLFQNASLCVAPSTGPLHLAVALGKPVVTFFPPIRVQSALRWGPYLREPGKASILVPEVYCGEDFKCRGSLCNYFPCMKSLSVSEALEQAHMQLSKALETTASKGGS